MSAYLLITPAYDSLHVPTHHPKNICYNPTMLNSKKVLNSQGVVELIDVMGDDYSVVNAARVSYGGDQAERPPEKDYKLLKYLLKNGHTSPFEHVTMTFHVKAPIYVARQWMRHRTWSYNEVSARYTKLEDGWHKPGLWRGQANHNKQMSNGIAENQPHLKEVYDWTMKAAMHAYEELIENGVSREQARMVLPVSMFTRFYATTNLHNFLKFVSLRDHEHAQPEIREYAQAMLQMARDYVAPWSIEIWEDLNK